MSSDRLDPTFSQLDAQLFSESLSELPAHADISEVICSELIVEIKDLALATVRRACELGVKRNRQYHKLPLANTQFEVLANFEASGEQAFDHLRVTTNKTTEMKPSYFSVDSQDFRLRLHAGTVAMRRSTQFIKGSPTDQLEGSLPVIWLTTADTMSRFTGRNYSLVPPATLHALSFTHLTEQRLAMQQLDDLLQRLNDVSFEQEYPY